MLSRPLPILTLLLLCLGPGLLAQDSPPDEPPPQPPDPWEEEIPGATGDGETPETYITRREAELDEGDLYGHLEIAEVAFSTHQEEALVRHCEAALKLDPDNRHAREWLGHTRYKREWLTPEQAEEAGLQEFDGEWLSRRDHAEHVKRRQWDQDLTWKVEKKKLFLETNTSRRKLAKYHEALLQFKAELEEVFRVPLKEKYRVHVYATEEDYRSIGRGPGGTLGYYSPASRDFHFFDDPDWVQARRIFFHEATHMFVNLTYRNKDFSYPLWLNEGMAEFFGGARFDYETGRYSFGHVLNERLDIIQGKIQSKRYTPLERFITEARGEGAYDQGWSLVLFLRRRDDGKWVRHFGHFLKLQRDSRYAMRQRSPQWREETLASFKKLFLRKGQTMEEFEQEWIEFVQQLKPEPGAPDFRTMGGRRR